MAPADSVDPHARLVSDIVFTHIVGHELRRAVRSQSFLTLLVLSPRPLLRSTPRPSELLPTLATLIAGEVRETDPLCVSRPAEIWLALLDTGFEEAFRVVDRMLDRLEHHTFDVPFGLRIGMASSPRHAADLRPLHEYARLHLGVHWNTGRQRARQSMA